MSEIVFKPPDSDCYYPADDNGECWNYPRFQVFRAYKRLVSLSDILAFVEDRIEVYEHLAGANLPPDTKSQGQKEAEHILRRLRELGEGNE